jgi:LysM repeat protein
MKFQLGDYMLSDTNAVPGSVYEVGIYVIAPGDTLAKIANMFQTSNRDLMAINPGLKPTRLYVGQKVRIYERKRN